MAEINYVKKQDFTTCCEQETHSKYKNADGLKVKGWKMTDYRK